MSYLVTARSASCEMLFPRNSLLAALEKALELQGCGMADVLTVDSSGRKHTAEQLHMMLFPQEARTTDKGLETRACA
ncbi:hypothetical protein [Methylobacterium oxalidis]|uniref:hypothetical protein n=1 Tax=Methylobacterium oxalidis TaxID=944322 RepID=UPI003315DEA5